MANEGMVLDTIDFTRGFAEIIGKVMPERLATGLFRAGAMLIRDSIKEEPRAPHRLGNLWRSQQVNKAVIQTNDISVDAGFNIEYAAYQHEGKTAAGRPFMRYSISRTEMVPADETTFGPKFLSMKLVLNREKYIKIAADYCLKG